MLKASFIALSENRFLRHSAEASVLGRRVSSRFVAGTTVEDAVRAIQETNALGMSVSVDYLGENVTNAAEARLSAELYHDLLDRLRERALDADISLKLTHMASTSVSRWQAISSGPWRGMRARMEILCVWTWKDRLIRSARSILFKNPDHFFGNRLRSVRSN
jgi:proline dehydrogenase